MYGLYLILFIYLFIVCVQWYTHGRDITNRRQAGLEEPINPITVKAGLLKQRWRFAAGFDITATPSAADGVVYFPSWNGNLYAVNARNGALIWSQNLGQLTGLRPIALSSVNVTVSRATPVVADDLLIVSINGPAYVIAVKRSTGQLVWSTQVDPGRASIVTASGTVYKG